MKKMLCEKLLSESDLLRVNRRILNQRQNGPERLGKIVLRVLKDIQNRIDSESKDGA